MKGDFSRDTFDPDKHFSRVLMQQGRVQLDADWNEQSAILLHYLRSLAADLIGPHGGPASDCGFEITMDAGKLQIGKGHYYVDGILCENKDPIHPAEQLGFPFPTDAEPNRQLGFPFPIDAEPNSGTYLLYLDVWERHITCIEDQDDGNPSIREVALDGPDTATRAKVVWQVKVTGTMPDGSAIPADAVDVKQQWLEKGWVRTNKWQSANRGRLKVRAKRDAEEDTDPCIASPEAHYRDLENQLYRVEIHKGGAAGQATFKWSRENGSVIFPILDITDDTKTHVKLANLGRDDKTSLSEDDRVEIVNDVYTLQNRAGPLLEVFSIDREEMTVTLTRTRAPHVDDDQTKHPLLRRWDHKAGAVQEGGLVLGDDGAALVIEDKWLKLERGVEIQFQTSDTEKPEYRTGDYWLIPARTATGDVEWPGPVGNPDPLPPHGVQHHYAPLGLVSVDANGVVSVVADCRRQVTTT